MPTTSNMSLVLPTPSVTPGPTYAELNNTAFTTIDTHDHTTGKGVKVPSSGLNINAALSFNSYGATALAFVAFTASSAPATTKSIYVNSSNDLYYYNASGASVQLTSGSSIAAVGSGVITAVTPGAYPYSVTSGNAQQVVLVDTTSAHTLNLPPATNAMAFWIKDLTGTAATYNITVTPDGSDTIDGAATLVLDENNSSRGLISDGTSKWYIF